MWYDHRPSIPWIRWDLMSMSSTLVWDWATDKSSVEDDRKPKLMTDFLDRVFGWIFWDGLFLGGFFGQMFGPIFDARKSARKSPHEKSAQKESANKNPRTKIIRMLKEAFLPTSPNARLDHNSGSGHEMGTGANWNTPSLDHKHVSLMFIDAVFTHPQEESTWNKKKTSFSRFWRENPLSRNRLFEIPGFLLGPEQQNPPPPDKSVAWLPFFWRGTNFHGTTGMFGRVSA